ncbi:hypothetical protein [Corynebacterium aquilae]|uniref:Uncharacterized protein n=1 Tax=Corynebacterium aquilae DSM 44791 TaxID=1431546 RepID=A0A1L7CFD3_9CORY|nr:hypothetical protein [Corynebacterium aquilae]APT84571.1 hypothetical protein CAQU_05285 [Corynebacterium aquilae DSM 44791]
MRRMSALLVVCLATIPVTINPATRADEPPATPVVVRASVSASQLEELVNSTQASTCQDVAKTYAGAPRNLRSFRDFMHREGFPSQGLNLTVNQEVKLMHAVEDKMMDCRLIDDDRTVAARISSYLSEVFGPVSYLLNRVSETNFGVTRFD